jgi:hypothetical protein
MSESASPKVKESQVKDLVILTQDHLHFTTGVFAFDSPLTLIDLWEWVSAAEIICAASPQTKCKSGSDF